MITNDSMENVIEGNKIIAEFMGATWKDVSMVNYPKNYKDWEIKFPEGLPFRQYGAIDEIISKHVKYHTSWDWLMPSWVKLRTDVWYGSGESYPKEFILYVENFKTACFNNSIGDARNAVIDGIQWYNTQTK